VKAIVALKLGRVSNLPTVWTNAVAGTLLAGAAPADARLPALLISMSLCYVAGMFLNDAFDRGFDARYWPERPIPAGEVSAVTVFVMGFAMLATGVLLLAWAGYSVAQGTRSLPVACGAALAAAIVLYDWNHKQNPLSPLLMGLCRWLIYVTAGFVFARTPPAQVFTVGALLLCYLIGLTYIAKQEHLGRIANLWPLAFIAIPALWALSASLADVRVGAFAALWLAWVIYSLSFLRRRRPGDVARAVGGLLAGICLWDAVVIAATGYALLALAALVLFGFTLLLQRYVAPT
jgi:hypothetical protein